MQIGLIKCLGHCANLMLCFFIVIVCLSVKIFELEDYYLHVCTYIIFTVSNYLKIVVVDYFKIDSPNTGRNSSEEKQFVLFCHYSFLINQQ